MSRPATYLSYLLLAACLAACSTGRKALQKGDYDKAVSQAINRLRSNEDSDKARSTLRKAYQYSVATHLDNINRAKLSNDPMRWEWIAQDYRQLNSLYGEVLRCPACREVVANPISYDSELAAANQAAAETRYNLGLEALAYKNVRQKAIEAHRHFLRAREFVPRYKDVEDKLQEALYHATLKVVVEPIPSPMRTFNIRHEFFENKINEYLHRATVNPYVRFYTQGEVQAQKLEYVDHIIRMEFDRFSLGNVQSSTLERELTRDSVVIAERNGEKIYGTVKATLKIYEKSISGNGLLDFKIYDNDLNKVITQEKMPSQYLWSIRWATFNGDERALGDEEKALVRQVEGDIPTPQRMFEEFTAPLYDQVTGKITAFYRGY